MRRGKGFIHQTSASHCSQQLNYLIFNLFSKILHMYQFASALLSFVLSPMLWIALLVLAGLLVQKKIIKKICWISALLVFLVFSNGWLLNRYARNFQPPPLSLPKDVVFSCGVIPGGFASPDIDGNGIFNSTADRFIQALTLFKKGHIKHIIVSGGNGKKEMSSFREAAWVKEQFIILGVPDSVIFVEDASNNTRQNAANTKKYWKAIIFHLPTCSSVQPIIFQGPNCFTAKSGLAQLASHAAILPEGAFQHWLT
jgi:uncharacterized SAM-binding protein YcdF (DUF218 family)